MYERIDGPLEPQRSKVLGLAAPRSESRTPEQTLGLLGPERSRVDG